MSRTDDLLTPQLASDERDFDNSLRPKRLSDFIGQEVVKQNLAIFIQAAKARGEVLDHVLLCGPPGLGKTTLAGIIAYELGVNFKVTSGPALERAGDLAAILTNLEAHDVLFIDEIHRLNRAVEEILYPAMEDFKLDIVIGKGPGARSIRLDVPPFTLVAATTRTGLITSPLRDRFGVTCRLDYYKAEELAEVVKRSAAILNVKINPEAAIKVGERSRGTPRVANRLLRRLRDFAEVKGDGVISKELAQSALVQLGVDHLGLDTVDQRLLEILIKKFQGQPVGLNTLAMALGEEPDTIEDVYEPFLVQLGLVKKTPRGRIATALAYKHLGLSPETNSLF